MRSSSDASTLRREAVGQDCSPIFPDRESPAATGAVLEFGRFRLLVRQRRLLAGGVPVQLGPRAFDILLILIEADGALVTHDDLQSRVWPGIVVARDNLKVQVSALRKALRDDRELIRTENGRGYRFTAAVRAAVVSECLSTRCPATQPTEPKSTPDTELTVIASRLRRLEAGLAEALDFLGMKRQTGRRQRYGMGHAGRRTRRRRPALTFPSPVRRASHWKLAR
jgi:DNA-binding winged helix-turn-helix (wHTH) protein